MRTAAGMGVLGGSGLAKRFEGDILIWDSNPGNGSERRVFKCWIILGKTMLEFIGPAIDSYVVFKNHRYPILNKSAYT